MFQLHSFCSVMLILLGLIYMDKRSIIEAQHVLSGSSVIADE